MKKLAFTLSCILLLSQLWAQDNTIAKIQYYFDSFPELGEVDNGDIITIASAPATLSDSYTWPVPTNLTAGVHQLYVRVQNVDLSWSLTENKAFYLTTIASSNLIEEMEYFVDDDPGVGNGTPISVAGAPTSSVSENVMIALPNDLTPGVHQLYIRARSENEDWSLTENKAFYITTIASSNLVEEMEYYVDDDPGVGNGTPISVAGAPTGSILENVMITLPTDLSPGVHQLYLRARSSNEAWSLTENKAFYVTKESGIEQITALEYYFDNDPGVGMANPIAITSSAAVSAIYPITVPCLSEGEHHLFVRAKDVGGDWSLIDLDTFTSTAGVPSVSVSPPGPLSICPGNSVDLTIVPVDGVTYQWVKDGLDILDETNETLTVTAGGDYSVKSICSGSFIISNVVTVTESTSSTYYADSDGDGYGNPLITLSDCTQPIGYVLDNSDCDDNDENVHPTATEVCNGVDDDCNTLTDDDDPGLSGGTPWYADTDGDGFGDASVIVSACSQPAGFVSDNTDCDDSDININPNGTEICNGLDDNCDLEIDEGVQSTFYADSDGDSYGDPDVTILDCTAPTGYVADNSDCDDTDINVNPAATEICNGIDDDCDLLIDDADPSLSNATTWYADTDGDGYGDPLSTLAQCTQPAGYVSDMTDCDDSDVDEFPGQSWYIDGDGDGYGTDANVVQCERPSQGFLASELTSISGDCDDADPAINPDSRYITYSSNAQFANSIIDPQTGSPYTVFQFEATYFDESEILPTFSFPRVILDYEGNGVFNNSNDRVIIMTESDANDVVTSDGKTYIASIDALTAGTNWTSRIQLNETGCIQEFGPFDYPDVLVSPDLEIFASDIVFSDNNPPVNSQITVTATIHNVSDYAAQNFIVHLENQADLGTVYSDQTVAYLAANASTMVSWNITTPPTEGWNPMEVSIDYTDLITETDEANNSAIRPFVNGDYYVPGEIVLSADASPTVILSIIGNTVNVSGTAEYADTAFPLDDPSVAGALVTITIVETGATYTTVTNSAGYYSRTILIPLAIGAYTVEVEITDFTLENTAMTEFEVVPAPCLPDLKSSVSLSSNSIIAGSSIDGTFTVWNIGCAATTQSTQLVVNHSGGTPLLSDLTVPALAPGESFTSDFSNLFFADPGVYTICSLADGGYEVVEASESNNGACAYLTVNPNLPNLRSTAPNGSSCTLDAPSSVSFEVHNIGAVAAGPFDVEVNISLDGNPLQTITESFAGMAAFSSNSFSASIDFSQVGVYSFEITSDATGILSETDVSDNVSIGSFYITECLPDLRVYQNCSSFGLAVSVDPVFPGTATYSATIYNEGDGTATGPIDVEFLFSGGNSATGTYLGDLPPNGSETVSIIASTVAPATESLTATVDPDDLITEQNEFNNSSGGELCWDFELRDRCGPDFWEQVYPVNQPISFSAGLAAHHLYTASSVNVRFAISGPGITGTVDIGDAIANDVEASCACPEIVNSPSTFAFPEPGTYTITMTVDPDDVYTECNEGNNVLVVDVVAIDTPDMQVLSEFIAPSDLNPNENEPITIDVTYENIGASNTADQMTLSVYVDEILLESIPVMGLVSGDNNTVSLTIPWSSGVAGAHVIRAVIDEDLDVTEANESNNEATRSIVVGAAGNLFFASLTTSNISPTLGEAIAIDLVVENEGAVEIMADVQLFYLDDNLNVIPIGSPIPITVAGNGTVALQIPWNVQDPSTIIIARIINSSPTEYTYDDNEAETPIGSESFTLSLVVTGDCDGEPNGTITATPTGGVEPFSYSWSNGAIGQALTAAAGTYTVTVEDATGAMVMDSATISEEDPEPSTECWETATFNETTCSWDVTGTQDPEPPTECWQQADFNNTSCMWEVTGTQDPEPPTECWQQADFNNTLCMWEVTGTQDPEPPTECWQQADFNNTLCMWEVTGTQDPEPPTECWQQADFNNTSCMWEVTGTQDPEPPTECWQQADFNNTLCMWEVTGMQDPEPPTECWQQADFNNTSCMWDVTGTQDPEPPTECSETVSFNNNTCTWVVSGQDVDYPYFNETPPPSLDLECGEAVPPSIVLTGGDNCVDGLLTAYFEEGSVSSDCSDGLDHSILRTWTLTDPTGNTTSHTQTITVPCCYENCETGYAYSPQYGTCFQDPPLNFNNWGWSIGQLGEGNYVFDIYAGAGQCDLNNGELAGELVVNYVGNTMSVEYNMLPGYMLEKTHLYVGCNRTPSKKKGRPTVALGQFPYSHLLDYVSHDSYVVDLSDVNCDEVYLIAHAAVCTQNKALKVDPLFSRDDFLIDVKLLPNPVAQEGTLQFRSMQDVSNLSISIYDLYGKLIEIRNISRLKAGALYLEPIAVGEYSRGIYSIVLTDGETVQVEKMVVSR